MEKKFWIDRWQNGDIAFHREEVHFYLDRHWGLLDLPVGSQVLVPLCGKSQDMVWLAEKGHSVVGVELSELAVDQFFAERGLTPVTTVNGSFKIKSAGPYELWVGDIFEFPKAAAAGVAAVYDRAALVAFPRQMQPAYVRTLIDIVPMAAPIFLVTLAYPESEIKGPPFSTSLLEVASYFGPTHKLVLVESRDGLEASQNLKARGLTRLEEALYILRRS